MNTWWDEEPGPPPYEWEGYGYAPAPGESGPPVLPVEETEKRDPGASLEVWERFDDALWERFQRYSENAKARNIGREFRERYYTKPVEGG